MAGQYDEMEIEVYTCKCPAFFFNELNYLIDARIDIKKIPEPKTNTMQRLMIQKAEEITRHVKKHRIRDADGSFLIDEGRYYFDTLVNCVKKFTTVSDAERQKLKTPSKTAYDFFDINRGIWGALYNFKKNTKEDQS